MNQNSKFFPNIDEYNAENYDRQSVTLENLDYLIYKIVARTGLTYDQVSIIVRIYFNEVRTQVLKGKTVSFGDLGKIFIKLQSSKRSKDKISLLIKFKATRRFLKKVKYNAIHR